MIDKSGMMRATTIGAHPPKPIDLKDREHFQVHKKTTLDVPFISKPVLGRKSGRWSVQLTRRVPDPDGSFSGVVVASMDPAQFSRFHNAIDLGNSAVVMLAGTDGIVRTATGSKRLRLGSEVSRTELVIASGNGNGVYTGDMDGSGKTRMFAVRYIPGHPLYVSVGISRSEIFCRCAPEFDSLSDGCGVRVDHNCICDVLAGAPAKND